MKRYAELCQFVARAIIHTTWNIPKIRDGDRWRNIDNAHLVENPYRVNGHDHYEDAIFRAKRIMEERGWNTELTDTKELPICGSDKWGITCHLVGGSPLSLGPCTSVVVPGAQWRLLKG